MKKVSIYLAVQSRITVCAIEAMLSSLTAVRGEVVGAGTDLKTCIEDIRRLKPELVLSDQEVCAVQNTYFCQKLTEENSGLIFICLQSAPCCWNLSGNPAVQILREDFTREKLTEALKICLQKRSRGEQEEKLCQVLLAVETWGEDTAHKTLKKLPQEEQLWSSRGGSLKYLGSKKEISFYLAEGKYRWMLAQEFQKWLNHAVGREVSRLLFYSLPFSEEEEAEVFPYLFEKEAERRVFYQSEPFAVIDLKEEQRKSFFSMQPVPFPVDQFSKILEKGSLRQAAAMMKLYLEQAGECQWDCELLKLNILEAALRLLQFQKPELTAGEAGTIKKKILEASKFTELQELWRSWTDSLLHKKEEGGIEEILHYIHTNYYEDLTLTGIAELFNYNYYYLSSAFFKQAGVTFTEYLNQVRIQEACSLLENTAIPISMAADMTGYSSPGYFSRTFKKYQKCSPSEYRRKVSEKKKQTKRQEN